MRTRIAQVVCVLQMVLLLLAAAAERAPYLGDWSNGRGETLAITSSTIQFGNDKPVAYRDVTRGTDGSIYELRITVSGEVNAFAGKTLALSLEGDSMQLTGYLTHADYMEEKKSQQVVTWERDRPNDAKQESD